jgi:glycogen debranching enzyme
MKRTKKKYGKVVCALIGVALLMPLVPSVQGQNIGYVGDKQGLYFSKKTYSPKVTPPKFAELRDKLPSPIYDDNPELVKLYWRTWQIAGDNFYEPLPESGFVSPYIDATFNENVFFWDTAFMTMFLNYSHGLTPGIASLDNFYAKQHEDGEICREISRLKGQDYWVNKGEKVLYSDWGWNFKFEDQYGVDKGAKVEYRGREIPTPPPVLSLDALNHPIAAWAEMESYQMTGDAARLKIVYPPLVKYYEALQKYLLQGNGLYITDWASLDNTPRNPLMRNGGTGIDISAEMVLYARDMAAMAKVIGKPADAKKYNREADALAKVINEKMWNAEKKFYFDLTLDGQQIQIRSIAGFWPLLAGVASKEQAKALADELNNPATFKRPHRVPTLAANEKYYDVLGDQWRGGIWAPTNRMVVTGLERYGYHDLAREIVFNNLENILKVYRKDGFIWENYSPEQERGGNASQTDFVGWSGVAPIMFFFEYAIGLRANAPKNELNWELRAGKRKGCERFRFNGHVVSLVAEPEPDDPKAMKVKVDSDGAFTLKIGKKSFRVKTGSQEFLVRLEA